MKLSEWLEKCYLPPEMAGKFNELRRRIAEAKELEEKAEHLTLTTECAGFADMFRPLMCRHLSELFRELEVTAAKSKEEMIPLSLVEKVITYEEEWYKVPEPGGRCQEECLKAFHWLRGRLEREVSAYQNVTLKSKGESAANLDNDGGGR